MNGPRNRPAEILLVEDNPDDVDLMLEALKETQRRHHVHVVEDGVEALAFLHRAASYANVPRPDIILLDLNLPKQTGHDVLGQIKSDPDLKLIPVVVLTTSASDQDILTCYRLNANCYITKPLDFESFTTMMQMIDGFWLGTATLPPNR